MGLGRVEVTLTNCLLKGRCVKVSRKWKDVFFAFIDLEKAYDTIDRHGMWQILKVYGVGGKLLKAVQSFYVDSRVCVRVGNDVSEWFPVLD